MNRHRYPFPAPIRVIAFAGVLLLLLSACASDGDRSPAGARPSWVDEAYRVYPSSQYLVGTGEAATAALAKDRARADLAKVFSVAIDERGEDSTVVRQDADGQQRQMLIRREIRTQTKQVLEGVEIADVWFDPEQKQYHALAILRRARTRRVLTEQIAPLDRQTGVYLEQAEASREVLARIAYLARALKLQRRRDALQRLLRVVDSSGRGIAVRWPLPAITAAIDDSFARLSVRPGARACDGSYQQGLEQALRGALAAAGMASDDAAGIDLLARLSLDDRVQRQGWYWLRGRLSLVLKDASGHVYGVRRWPLKQSATEVAMVERRIMDQIATILKRDLRATVSDFAVSALAEGGRSASSASASSDAEGMRSPEN